MLPFLYLTATLGYRSVQRSVILWSGELWATLCHGPCLFYLCTPKEQRVAKYS